MKYELTLNNTSTIKKIVEDSSRALYSNGEITSYNIKDFNFFSKRNEYIKEYRNALQDIPKVKDYIDGVILNNGLIGLYAELYDSDRNTLAREWYMAFNSKEDFLNVFRSMKNDIPTGELWDLFCSDIKKYRYTSPPDGYDYSLSIEIADEEVVIDWYMCVPKDMALEIKRQWNV